MIVPPVASRVFVGRRAELEALRDRRRDSAAGRGSVVLVGGEAGLGKSRLLGEFVRGLSGGRGPLVAGGECLEHAPRPLGPFRSVVTTLVSASPWLAEAVPAFVMRAVAQVVPHALSDAERFVDAPRLGKADLFDALVLLLQTVAAKRAVVITIEDLHWADPATLDLLRHIAPRVAGMRALIVASFRDESIATDSALGAALARLQREGTVHQISLAPLSRDAVRELLVSALVNRELASDRVLDEIERLCEGNPFFAEELLKRSLEREDAESALPISIRATIAQRLGKLSAAEQAVLQHAAVLGYRFDSTTLALIAERDVAEVMAILTRARDLNLIVEEPAARIKFRFRHALMRQTLYESMLNLAARPLHERIARALESLPDAHERLDELAYHWWEARDPAKALEYGDRAGDAAFAVNAFSEAANYFQRAVELVANDDERRSRMLQKLALSLNAAGLPEQALRVLQEAIEICVARGDFDFAARMITSSAGQLNNAGDMQAGIDLIDRFVAARESELTEHRIDEMRATQAFIVSNLNDAARVRGFLDLVKSTAHLEPMGRMHYWGARAIMNAVLEERDALLEDVATLLGGVPSGMPVSDVASILHVGRTLMLAGFPDRAEDALLRSIELSKRYGFAGFRGCAHAIRAANLWLGGRLDEARAAINAAMKYGDLAATRYTVEVWGPLVGVALDDRTLIERSLAFGISAQLRARKNDNSLGIATATAAIAAAAADRAVEARALMAEAVDCIGIALPAAPVLGFAARYVDGPRLEKLLQLTETAASSRVVASAGAHVRAVAAERKGDAAGARSWGAEAARLYRELGWRILEGQALELAGRSAEAAALYRAAGSVDDLRRIDLRTPAPAAAARASGDGLSEREREVATLVARGLTNRAVAERLFVGEKTVEKHVTAIYAKLGFSSRAGLAGYMASRSGDDAAVS